MVRCALRSPAPQLAVLVTVKKLVVLLELMALEQFVEV